MLETAAQIEFSEKNVSIRPKTPVTVSGLWKQILKKQTTFQLDSCQYFLLHLNQLNDIERTGGEGGGFNSSGVETCGMDLQRKGQQKNL